MVESVSFFGLGDLHLPSAGYSFHMVKNSTFLKKKLILNFDFCPLQLSSIVLMLYVKKSGAPPFPPNKIQNAFSMGVTTCTPLQILLESGVRRSTSCYQCISTIFFNIKNIS